MLANVKERVRKAKTFSLSLICLAFLYLYLYVFITMFAFVKQDLSIIFGKHDSNKAYYARYTVLFNLGLNDKLFFHKQV